MSQFKIASHERTTLIFSGPASLSSPTSSLNRRHSVQSSFSAVSNPPPLIPAPQSFLKRQTSVSSSASSLSSSKLGNKLPLPPPIPTNQDFPSDAPFPPPPPPISDNNVAMETSSAGYSERQSTSALGSESYTRTNVSSQPLHHITSSFTQLPVSLPLFPLSSDPQPFNPSSSPSSHFKFPSPPSTPPPPITPPETTSSYTNTSVSSTMSLSPQPDEAIPRKHSKSPSEVMGYLDEAIGDCNFSASSYNDAIDYPEFSPAFNFSSTSDEKVPEPFTPELSSTTESPDVPRNVEEKRFLPEKTSYKSEHSPGVAVSHNGVVTTKSSEDIAVIKTRILVQEEMRKSSDTQRSRRMSTEGSDDHFGVDIPKPSLTSKDERKKSLSVTPRKISVSKLQPDIKTVRQQIKPGTVGELTNLFTKMKEEHVVYASKRDFDLNIQETAQQLKNLETNNEEQSSITDSRGSSYLSHEELSSRLHCSELDKINSKINQPQSSGSLQQSRIQSNSSLDVYSVQPDPRIPPGLDFLSASREIFKHVVSSRSSNRTNSTKDVSNLIKEPDLNVDKSSAHTSHEIYESEHTCDLDRTAYVNMADGCYLNMNDMEEQGSQIHYNANEGESTSRAMYVADGYTSESKLEATANVPKNYGAHNTHLGHILTDTNDNGDVWRITGSQKPNICSTSSPISPRPQSPAISDAEPLRTLTNSNNKGSSININKDQHSLRVNKYDTSSDTAVGGQTGSNNEVQTNQVSVCSQLDSGAQAASKLQGDSYFNESPTSSSKLENLMVTTTTLDSTSDDVTTMTDDGTNANPSQTSDTTCSEEKNAAQQDVTEGNVPDSSDIGSGISVIFDKGQITSNSSKNSVYSSTNENCDFTVEEIEHERHEVVDNAKRLGSSTTDFANARWQTADDLHTQTEKELEAVLYVHPRRSSQKTEVAGSVDETEEGKDDVILRNISYTEEISGGSLYPEVAAITDLSPTGETRDTGRLNRNGSKVKQSDEFMSILEDIKIETDITSSFLRSSRRSGNYPAEKPQESKQVESYSEDDHVHTKDAQDFEHMNKDSAKGIYTEDAIAAESLHRSFVELNTEKNEKEDLTFMRSVSESTEMSTSGLHLSAPEKGDLNDEIKKQHNALSRELSETSEHENSLAADHDKNRSTRSSVSSTCSSHNEGHSIATKETLFNSEFFSGSQSMTDTINHISSNQDSLNTTTESPLYIPSSEYEKKSQVEFLKNTLSSNEHFHVENICDTNNFNNSGHSDKTEMNGTSSNHENFTKPENIHGTKNLLSESDWMVPTESSRSVPWSEYEEMSHIEFNASVNEVEQGPDFDLEDRRSSLSSVSTIHINESPQGKTTNAAASSDIFSKSTGIIKTAHQSFPSQESLILASTVSRAIPWEKYEDKLRTPDTKNDTGSAEVDKFIGNRNVDSEETTSFRNNVTIERSSGEGINCDKNIGTPYKSESFISEKVAETAKENRSRQNSLIVASEISRSISWSEYEETSQIVFKDNSGSSKHAELQTVQSFEQDDPTSSRSSVNSVYNSGNKSHLNESNKSSFNREFVKSENTTETAKQSISRQNSLIVATDKSRSVPWSEYEERSEIEFQDNSISNEHTHLQKAFELNDTSSSRNSFSSVHTSTHKNPEAKATSFNREFYDTLENNDIGTKGQAQNNHPDTTTESSGPVLWSTYEESSKTDLNNRDGPEDGNASDSEKKRHRENSTENMTKYSVDSCLNSFAGPNQLDYNHEGSNTEFISVKQTNKTSITTSQTAQTASAVSYAEEESTKQKEDASHLFVKDKFQALRNVFESRELENHSKPTASFHAKRNSFKFGTNPSSPLRAASGSTKEKNVEMSIQAGRNVTSQLETGERLSRDADQRGVDLPLSFNRNAEIDTPEDRDGEGTDTSNESTSGSDVDTRTRNKKSKQTNLSYDLQTGELVRGSLTQTSSVTSTSLNTSELKTTVSDIRSQPGNSSVETEGFVKPETASWISETVSNKIVLSNDLDNIVNTSSDSYISSPSGKEDIFRQTSSVVSPEGSFKITSSGKTLQEAGTNSVFEPTSDKSISRGSETYSVHVKKVSLRQTSSVNSNSGTSVSSSRSSFEIEDINSSPEQGNIPDSLDKDYAFTCTKTDDNKQTINEGSGFGVRRQSSTESDKQTELIDSFLKSGVGSNVPKNDSAILSRKDNFWRPTSQANADKSSVRGHSLQESINRIEKNDTHSHNQNETFSFDSDSLSRKIKTDYSGEAKIDHSEPNFLRSVSSENKNNENMTAIVGEVSSFSILKKITSHEESFGIQSENAPTSESPRDNTQTRHDQTGSDIYLIQDEKGDYYALQEVDDSQTRTNVDKNNVNLHVVETSKTDGHYMALNGHVSHDTALPNNGYYPNEGARTDIYVDSSAVDDDKAREVISAYLDSQDLSRQRQSNNSTDSVYTFQESSTATKHYSQRNSSDERGRWDSSTANNSTGKLFTVTNSGVANSPTFVSSPDHGTVVVHQQGYSGGTNDVHFQSDDYINSMSYKTSSTHQRGGLLKNSTVYDSIDNSQALNKSRFEDFTVDNDDRDSYTSSLRVTNLHTPQGRRPQSAVVDTAYDTHRSGEYSRSPTTTIRPIADNVNQILHHSVVNPFQATPLTITTTTQAVVGEQVGMHIDYPHNGVADNFSSSSDDESNQKRYVVKNLPQKSSLKKISKHNSSSFSDSSSDIVFTKGETFADLNHGVKTRDINPQHFDADNRYVRTASRNDSFSPRSAVEGPVYRVYQSPRSASPSDDHSFYSQDVQKKTFSLSKEKEGNNLYRVRNLSTSVPDGLHYIEDQRGRSGTRSPSYSDTKTSYKILRQQHHSPERFFKNPTLSLRKEDNDSNDNNSDEDTDNKRFRTVTKVYLNENHPTPEKRYKVSSLQSQDSYQNKQEQVAQTDNRIYEVVNVKSSENSPDGLTGFSDETDSGYQEQQQRYKIIGTSDSSKERHEVNAHSSPKLDRKHMKSYEEATVIRTESIQPSRLSNVPPSTRTHKTEIQLELASNKIKGKNSSEEVDSRYMIKRVKSADDLLRDTRTTINVQNLSSDESKMWRTGRSRSTDKYRNRSSSDEDDRFQQAGVYDSSPRFVKTLKQKDGNKLYVVNSTVGESREDGGPIIHPPGWYKSTIDINQNSPENVQPNDQHVSNMLNEHRSDSHYNRAEKTVYFVRETTPQTNVGKVLQRTHSTEFVYPDSGQGTEIASSDGENEIRQKFERVERIYEVRSEPKLPEHFQSMEDLSNDLRVLRGNILIKNRLNDTDHGEDDFDENVNLFDNSFHLGKDNPLFSSDQDILASLRKEEQEELSKHVHQDITFETVDKIAHEYKGERHVQVKPPPPRKKQNLSALLLSKLANVDSKDIRQTIDVEHHNEEIYGDIDFIHADGERKASQNTRNFDSVNENVELTLTQGKAHVIIKVIAERIVPTDLEFNVWRKSQAIVTRRIEIDLLANEQRRRLYKHVMASAGIAGSLEDGSRSHYYDTETLSPQERQLSSIETLKLFSQILDVTDGQGDKDFTETRTRQEMGQLPPSAMDLLY